MKKKEKREASSILLNLIVTFFHNNKPVSKAFYNQHLSQSLDTSTVLQPRPPFLSSTVINRPLWLLALVRYCLCALICVWLSTCETPHCYTMCEEFHAIIGLGPENIANKTDLNTSSLHVRSQLTHKYHAAHIPLTGRSDVSWFKILHFGRYCRWPWLSSDVVCYTT